MSYDQIVAAERRFRILELLVRVRGTANEDQIYAALEMLRVDARITKDAVRSDLRFLEKRDLVVTVMIADTIMTAEITKRGGNVARGKLEIEGVKSPDFEL